MRVLTEQLLPDMKKAVEAMNPVFSVREDVNALHVSFPKYVAVNSNCTGGIFLTDLTMLVV